MWGGPVQRGLGLVRAEVNPDDERDFTLTSPKLELPGLKQEATTDSTCVGRSISGRQPPFSGLAHVRSHRSDNARAHPLPGAAGNGDVRRERTARVRSGGPQQKRPQTPGPACGQPESPSSAPQFLRAGTTGDTFWEERSDLRGRERRLWREPAWELRAAKA